MERGRRGARNLLDPTPAICASQPCNACARFCTCTNSSMLESPSPDPPPTPERLRALTSILDPPRAQQFLFPIGRTFHTRETFRGLTRKRRPCLSRRTHLPTGDKKPELLSELNFLTECETALKFSHLDSFLWQKAQHCGK